MEAEMAYSITIPKTLYQQLTRQAQQANRSIDELVQQTLSEHMPDAAGEEKLPDNLRQELDAMSHLSDDALWQIAESGLNADKVAMYDLLLERRRENSLTAAGQTMLDQLREETDALTLRKAHAYLLLKNRGYQLPTLHEMQRKVSLN
jgi:hypothetical protein